MHRLHALRRNRRCIEGEGYGQITIAEGVRVRCNSIHSEIGCLDTAVVDLVAQVDDELRRLSVDDAVAGRVGSGHGKTYQLAVGEGILLRSAADGHAPVGPRSDALGEDRSAIVVIAYVAPYDERIALRWQRTDYVRERIVRQPAQAVVGGLARPHPVTRRGWVTILAVAVGALPRVIPCREEGAGWADRKVRLPLRPGSGISVQLKRGTECNAAVARANVIDVARITASAVLGIDQVNNVVKCCRFTPAFVPPVAAVSGKYPGKVTRRTHARAREGCARIGVTPTGTAIS